MIGGNSDSRNERPVCPELKRQVYLAKQLQHGHILHPLGRFFVLFILLRFELFGEVTLTVAMELGLIAVFAENTGDIVLIDMIIRDGSPRADGWQQRCDEKDINQRGFHVTGKGITGLG